jgi:alpha-galactosidase
MRLGAERAARRCKALAATAALAAVAALAPGASAGATSAVLSPTPYMGWDTYFAFGSHYDEATVLEQASNLVTDGMQKAGYRLLWLDVGWWQLGTRNAAGQIVVNPVQWPHGMAWFTRTLHAMGFKVGLYSDAGINGCGGINQGMYGHYQQDVNTFARWGFDALKVDFCGGDDLHLSPKSAYTQIHEAILHDSPHRPMLLDVCVFPEPGQVHGYPPFGASSFSSYSFGPSVANSWRTDTDVGSPAGLYWYAVVRNMNADATQPSASGPGHWNNPDYLGPNLGLSNTEFQTQFSMWAMLDAPLMVSANLSTLTQPSLATILNHQMIAIDQDPLAIQARLLAPALTSTVPYDQAGEVWYKPLANGGYAVALLNLDDSTTLTISTTAHAIGMPAASSYKLASVWGGATATSNGTISATVAPHQTVVYVVTPQD